MPKRKIRVDELLKREISEILHTDYRSEAVYLTITSVDVSPDLRQARIYYSVFGGDDKKALTQRLLRTHASDIRRKVARRVVLKYLPFLDFIYDYGPEKGFSIIEKLDELDQE